MQMPSVWLLIFRENSKNIYHDKFLKSPASPAPLRTLDEQIEILMQALGIEAPFLARNDEDPGAPATTKSRA